MNGRLELNKTSAVQVPRDPGRNAATALHGAALDHDRANGHVVVQPGNSQSRYLSRAVVGRMSLAAEGYPLLVRARNIDVFGQLALGYLESDNPWSMGVTERPPGLQRSGRVELGLIANFVHVRMLEDAYLDVADGSEALRVAATESPIRSLTVDLDPRPAGRKDFPRQLAGAPEGVAVGWNDIYDTVYGLANGAKERDVWCRAVTLVARALAAERA